MSKLLLLLVFILPSAAFAASSSPWPMEDFDPDLENKPSLQNGMKLYMNYCIGCHSLMFQRYERTADDLGIPHEIALEQLIFSGQKIGELMTTAMDPELAKNWFGGPPPDLTMVTRARSPDWVFNYLKTFYIDDSRPFGVNNTVFANVGMPNVMQDLQGVQTCTERKMVEGSEVCSKLVVEEGSGVYSEQKFDQAVYDLVNFLYYVSEPARLERQRTGLFVLIFLVILGVFTYLLNREIWKDIH
ncbi:MAG: cytochrome c1 [Proteobacteria bacterium]|nr:cytochrome c1 [Pseudomonadota bacterium]